MNKIKLKNLVNENYTADVEKAAKTADRYFKLLRPSEKKNEPFVHRVLNKYFSIYDLTDASWYGVKQAAVNNGVELGLLNSYIEKDYTPFSGAKGFPVTRQQTTAMNNKPRV